MQTLAQSGPRPPAQRGFSIIIVLMVLVVIGIIGLSASNLSTTGEVASRNSRDYHSALQAAEAALHDAMLDISCVEPIGVPHTLSAASADGTPAWREAANDLRAATPSAAITTYGSVTANNYHNDNERPYQNGSGSISGLQPYRAPRYLVEALATNSGGSQGATPNTNAAVPEGSLSANGFSRPYLITAIGWGPSEAAHVIVQATYIHTPAQHWLCQQ